MSYAVGSRQFSIRDFRRAIFDENPVGNVSDFRRAFDRKSLVLIFQTNIESAPKNTAVSLGLAVVYEAQTHHPCALWIKQ